MGQYYKIVNLDKKEYINPHRFGDGLKLMEFGASGDGTMLGLAILLADSNGRGGGDLRSDNLIIGSWAGDRIVVTGDYGDTTPKYQVLDSDEEMVDNTLYIFAEEFYKDISYEVILALFDDSYTKQQFLSDGFFRAIATREPYEDELHDVPEEILQAIKDTPEPKRGTNKSLRPDMVIGLKKDE